MEMAGFSGRFHFIEMRQCTSWHGATQYNEKSMHFGASMVKDTGPIIVVQLVP